MVPFVRLYTRRFHFTSKIFLRKVAPKTTSIDQKHNISENNGDSPTNFQTCHDYLGIESEENVIAVIPQKHRFQQVQKSETRERFYRASFGIVRLDSDNKLRRHGQFEKKVDFVFPHCSSDDVKVSNVSKTPNYKNPIDQDLSWKDSQKISAADTLDIKTNNSSSIERKKIDENYIDECYFGTHEANNFLQKGTQSPELEKLNFIDKDYFGTLDQSKNESLGSNSTTYSNQEINSAFYSKNTVEEINYFEKDYFQNNPENLHVEQNSADYYEFKQNYPDFNDQNKFIKSNNIEKSYPTLSNSESSQEEKTSNFEDEVDSNWNSEDKFKKDYLETLSNLENDPVEQYISNYTDVHEKKNSFVFEKNDFTNDVDKLSFPDSKMFENSSSPSSLNSLHYDEFYKSPSFTENNSLNIQDIHNQSSRSNQDYETDIENKKINAESNDYSVNELNKNALKQAYKVNSEKMSFSKTQKNDISHIKYKPSVKNLNMPEELLDKTVKSFSSQNYFKFSKIASEETNQENQEPTAHDFVEKLREEQKIPCQIISKGKSKNEVKFDSKGFRILKNQVPNLSYFTHDEILNILKENVVYSDDDLLVLNKPYSLVIHDSKTTKEPCLSTFLDDLAKEMDKQSTSPKLFTVHRLDKETTGCILLARNETMAMKLKALFAQRKIVKKYWVITAGVPDPPEGVIDIPISEGSINNRKRMVLHPKLPSDIPYKSHSEKGKPAVTTYKVISQSGNAALVEVFPKTGIKHQIRVHFGFGLGCPILGDHKYSHLDKLVPQKLPSDMLQKLHVRQSKVRHIPMHIHAKSVGIPAYFDNRDLFVNIPIPEHFKANLKRLKFRKKDMIH